VFASLHPGAIVLMHDGGGDRTNTVAALPAIINGLKSKGYTIVQPTA
jgi:peptidoglycan/xylan/chitin deacetylase (PgdA/CDA1 family)